MVALAENSAEVIETVSRARAQLRTGSSSASRCSKSETCNALSEHASGWHARLGTCTRDPVGFRGSKWNFYEFLGSSVLRRTDPDGLIDRPIDPTKPGGKCFPGCVFRGDPPEVDCSTICRWAIGDPRIPKEGGGGVICYMGRKCACAFGGRIGGIPVAPGDCPMLDRIIEDHEEKHFPEVDCKDCTLHRPEFKPGVDRTKAECSHRRASIKQLDDAIADSGTPDRCKVVMQRLRDSLQRAVDANCPPESLIIDIPDDKLP